MVDWGGFPIFNSSTSQSRGMVMGQETEGVSQAAGSRQGGRDVERSDVPPR